MNDDRMAAAIARAVETGRLDDLHDQLARGSNMPSPRPNLDLARAVGAELAALGGRADRVVRALGSGDGEYTRIVAAFAFAARYLRGVDARGALADLQEIAEDPRHSVRAGVVAALRFLVEERGDAMLDELVAFTDGYLHAHAALEALADKNLLASIRSPERVLARLDEAFELADVAPRAADRSQGLRTLRRGLPAQIVAFAARFPETLGWLEQRAAHDRPETREVIAEAIAALRKASLARAEVARLEQSLKASAKPPRDPSRIVQGTRKRSKNRR
jgi:hypothetical protein